MPPSSVVVAVSALSVDCWRQRLGRGSCRRPGQGSHGVSTEAGRPWHLGSPASIARILSSVSPASLLASLQLLGRLPKLTETCRLAPRLGEFWRGGLAVSQMLISQELMSRAFIAEQCLSEERCWPGAPAGDLLNFTIGALFSFGSSHLLIS